MGKRPRVEITSADQKEIIGALERWARSDDFVGLRLRAFVYLLWDGALRTKMAIALNAEDLVKDPGALRVVQEVVQAPCEANRYREIRFFVSRRAREAIADYLKVVRRDGWLPTSRFEGPLFISVHHHGTGQRAAARTMQHSFREFLQTHTRVQTLYTIEDLVYTGRMAFLEAADGDTSKLSEHASLTEQWVAKGFSRKSSGGTKDVLDRLDRMREKS